jgi:hypothetical protein
LRATGDPVPSSDAAGACFMLGSLHLVRRGATGRAQGQLHDCWVQLTPLGVQMPQLGLQHDVPGAQIAPPHDTTSGPSASVAGTGSDRGAAGAGHSGHSRAQIGVPVQPMHNLSGG